MMLAVNLFLWVVVGVLGFMAAMRGTHLFRASARESIIEFLRLIPRIALGVIGSGFIADAMPQDLIVPWIGPQSGMLGVAIATIGGGATSGGPVVGFSIAAAALKGGAGAPQVIAFVTAWSLFSIQRIIGWEIPAMPPRVVWLRAAVSVPLPFIAAAGAMLLAKP
ncbi:MAG TPA: hypothetical protein VMJ52_18320 [Xanthobacteraceae bacterium]|nr:hypothetical protein [Xanthobacteraceae bacterium]